MFATHTLWSLFSLNVYHFGVCAAEKCVGGCWCPAGTTSSLCIHCPAVHVGWAEMPGAGWAFGAECSAATGPYEDTEAAGPAPWQEWRRHEKCTGDTVMPASAYWLSRLQAVLNVKCALVHSIILGVTKHQEEGSGTPLQHSCLENPMDGGAWWASISGVAQSRTRLKRLSSSSSSSKHQENMCRLLLGKR